jgi:isoleucyl-tRNA synthetase
VHLTEFPEARPEMMLTDQAAEVWDELLRMRGVVSKVLEEARREGKIGASLEAAVTLTPGDEHTLAILKKHEAQLPWVFIVSHCAVLPVSEAAAQTEERLLVNVDKAGGAKCVRCWNYQESVGNSARHPQICSRCEAQLGEIAL